MLLGLGLACACALVTNAGFLIRHGGAVEAPPVDGRHPLGSSARGLFASRWWTIGWLAAAHSAARTHEVGSRSTADW
jgi:hypothetical protein